MIINLLILTTAPAQIRIMPIGDSVTWGRLYQEAPAVSGMHGYRDFLYQHLSAGMDTPVNFIGPQPDNPMYDAVYHDPPYEGYFRDDALIEQFLPDSIYDIQSMLDHLEPDSIPDAVVLYLGTHDMERSVEIGNYQTPGTILYKYYRLVDLLLNYSRDGHTIERVFLCMLIPRAEDPGLGIVFPNVNHRIELFNARMRAMVIGHPTWSLPAGFPRVQLTDLYTPFYSKMDVYYEVDIDPVCPNPTGYEAMADILAAYFGIIPSDDEIDYLILLTPDEDAIWYSGDTKVIQWSSPCFPGTDFLRLEYTIDNGRHWDLIGEDIERCAFQYPWKVPSFHSDSCLLKITSEHAQDISGRFSIRMTPSLELIFPSDRFISVHIDSTYEISWDGSDTSGFIRLELFQYDQLIAIIADSAENNGSFDWLVPNNVPLGSDYYIKITDLSDTTFFDFSDISFQIIQASWIKLISDNSSVYQTDDLMTIVWVTLGETGEWVTLELYCGFNPVLNIADSTENDGEFIWTIPSGLPSQVDCRIKITSCQDSVIYDYSDEPFRIESASGIERITPLSTKLFGNFPNPFNPSTTIQYDLAKPSDIRLTVYDIRGRCVYEIRKHQPSGIHHIEWNAGDLSDRPLPGGVYFYRLEAGEYRCTRKMVVVK